jgi:hypothetical protein
LILEAFVNQRHEALRKPSKRPTLDRLLLSHHLRSVDEDELL